MTAVVIDASVSIKWAISNPEIEADVPQATCLLQAISDNTYRMVQPKHWILEMAGVLALKPDQPPLDVVGDLMDLGFIVADDLTILAKAIAISQHLRHHLFDTLYHAVALAAPDRTLITADERYFRKAFSYGQIMRLADWPI